MKIIMAVGKSPNDGACVIVFFPPGELNPGSVAVKEGLTAHGVRRFKPNFSCITFMLVLCLTCNFLASHFVKDRILSMQKSSGNRSGDLYDEERLGRGLKWKTVLQYPLKKCLGKNFFYSKV